MALASPGHDRAVGTEHVPPLRPGCFGAGMPPGIHGKEGMRRSSNSEILECWDLFGDFPP